jgi:hypothetical protein
VHELELLQILGRACASFVRGLLIGLPPGFVRRAELFLLLIYSLAAAVNPL